MTTLIIGSLLRDVVKERSVVTLTWEDDPEKRLGLVVPFDCTLENLKAETEKAVCALAKEIRVSNYTERLTRSARASCQNDLARLIAPGVGSRSKIRKRRGKARGRGGLGR